MPLRTKKKPTSEKQKQAQHPQPEAKKTPAEKPKTSSSSTTKTTSKPSPAALIQHAIQQYGDNTTRMFSEIMQILGMNPDLEKAEEQTNEMRETLQSILAAVEEVQIEERDRFKKTYDLLLQQQKTNQAAAEAMQQVVDALKASQH